MANVTIRGLERFKDELSRLDFAKQKDVLVSAALEAVEPLRLEIGVQAPVGETGILSRSIEKQEDRKQSTLDAVTVDVGPTSRAFYGLFQEFGTAHHVAQPFVEPAIEESTHEIEDGFVEALNYRIEHA